MLLTQYRIKKGLEVFKTEGIDAVLKQLKQMHALEVVDPLHRSKVTNDMLTKALKYLMFSIHKRTGTVKGCGCADRHKQKAYAKKEDAAAQTFALQVLLLSCLQDSTEGRKVTTCDIPGAFLQTDQPKDDEVIIKFTPIGLHGPINIQGQDPIHVQGYKGAIRTGKEINPWYSKRSISVLAQANRQFEEVGIC